jgi:hypothetical protein
MRPIYYLIGCLYLCALTTLPAQAFTLKTMTITLGQNGDAQADLQYQLSPLEESAVFLHIANPATELQNALNENLNIPVMVE